MIIDSFRHNLQFGQVGESRIASWLKRQGWNILPAYEKEIDNGKGPRLFCADGMNLIAPDILAFNESGQMHWFEAKHKSVFSYYRIGERWVTGIDLRHYRDYLEVQKRSPWPIWLMFLHTQARTNEPPYECPTGLFGQKLWILECVVSHTSDRWGKSGMVYWAAYSLKKLAELSDVLAASNGSHNSK